MLDFKIQSQNFEIGYFGWKYYNVLRKKAMEQEFSWAGLVISLSIAFFIVLASAEILSLIHQSIITNQQISQLGWHPASAG